MKASTPWWQRPDAPFVPGLTSGLAVPMRAASLAGLPPTLIVTAEADLLRDEGEAFAARLAADGVAVTCRRFPGVLHGFLSTVPLHPQSQAAFGLMAAFLSGQD